MKKLKNYNCYKEYKVYERTLFGPEYLDETWAVSAEKAVNNVRWNHYGKKRYNEDFFAEESDPDCSNYKWYTVEYCVQNGYDPYYEPKIATYKVVFAGSSRDAAVKVRNSHYYYGNGSDLYFREVYFNRIVEFDTKKEAYECAYILNEMNKEEHNL